MSDEKYCKDCKRIKTTGCACGLTFAEKIKTIKVDKTSLLAADRKN